MSDTPSSRRRLLVATPSMNDPRFARTVILMIERGEIGAMGIVLNQPTEIEVEAVLARWAGVTAEPPVLFRGGPVDSSVAIALAMTDAAEDPPGFTRLFGRLGVVDLGADVDEVSAGVDRIRVFSGYAGWSSGQLEGEIAVGAWFEFEPEPDDAFTTDLDGLWERVVRRQGGKYVMYANYPEDPSQN